jgi:hypothetical protein
VIVKVGLSPPRATTCAPDGVIDPSLLAQPVTSYESSAPGGATLTGAEVPSPEAL